MNIKTSSWHYRLIKSTFNRVPHSLCPYFWKLVFALLIIAMISVVAICALFSIGCVILKVFGFQSVLALIAAPFIGAGVVFIFGAIGIGGAILIGIAKDKRRIKKYENRNKEDGLIVSFVKAKKEKICPTLNFVL